MIKEYFANYFLHMSDVTFDMQNNQMTVHNQHAEPWKVTLVDTGDESMTSGRLARVKEYYILLVTEILSIPDDAISRSYNLCEYIMNNHSQVIYEDIVKIIIQAIKRDHA